MFYTDKKVEQRICELADFRYREAKPIEYFRTRLDETGEVAPKPPTLNNGWGSLALGECWKGWDTYAWLATEIEIPPSWEDKKILMRLDLGRTGDGNNSGFESLLYLNGEPYQAVDSNHQEVFFPPELAGTRITIHIRLWSGLNGGGRPVEQEYKLKVAELCWLDEQTDDLFYWGTAVLGTLALLREEQTERHELRKAANRSVNLIDWSRPGSSKFYQSIAQANQQLQADIAKIEKNHEVTIHCVGHTHIDVAWLWRLKHTREKAGRSFSTVLRLMEMYPEYVFLQTQPQLYDYLKTDYPQIYSTIKKRIVEKRWEAEGGMWVEADCNITSGESLVRQLLLGIRFLKEEFGVDCTFLWLPDVFGYSWSLPQILKKSGISTFMTTKISWNQYNRMPHDTFKWRGIDGTEILTHFITATDDQDPNSWRYTYNGVISPATILGTWNAYRDKNINKDLLVSYGYGDGGGGVNRDMLEMRRRLDQMPGLPNVKPSRADDFFKTLNRTFEQTSEYVHTWDGELYLEYHRGTYTSQAYNKKMNRKLELLYRETEWLSTLSSLVNSAWENYPQKELNDGWKTILRHQFHDIIPGSSIREVYEDSAEEYAECQTIGIQAWERASNSLVESADNTFTVFNSAPWLRDDMLTVSVEDSGERGHWVDCEGQPLQADRQGENWLVYVKQLPSMGYKVIRFEPDAQGQKASMSTPFTLLDSGIITPYFEIDWNDSGQLTSIFDRQAKRQVLAEGKLGNVFQVFEDKPMAHDAWDIDIYYQEKMRLIEDLVDISVIEKGQLRVVIRFQWRYMDSTLTQDMVVSTHSKRIDFRTKVDWHEEQQLLKVAFPVEIRSTEATYDIQFGNVKRPTHWNTSWDWARFETVAHQWADLSERGYGVSILNDCKYGHDIKDNVMRLSLIKSAIHPDYLADQGTHEFTYSLLPHEGDWVDGGTVQEAWQLNNPLLYRKGQAEANELSFFSLNKSNVMIDAVKKSEDGNEIIVRIHEFAGQTSQVKLNSAFSFTSWQEVDLLECPCGDVMEGSIEFTIKPYEITTFSITPC